MVRSLLILSLAVTLAKDVCAQQYNSSIKTGDLLVITMTDQLAKEYARATQSKSLSDKRFTNGVRIQTLARIEQQLADGQTRFEHSRYLPNDGDTRRLITLTGTIAANRIMVDATPKGRMISATPDSQPVPSTVESRMLRLTLSNLKGLKLRTWTLSEENGE